MHTSTADLWVFDSPNLSQCCVSVDVLDVETTESFSRQCKHMRQYNSRQWLHADRYDRVIDAAQLKHRDRLKSSVSLFFLIAVSSIAWLSRSFSHHRHIHSTLILSAIRL